MSELLIGCGARHGKLIPTPSGDEWSSLTTLDINPAHKPDRLWDLMDIPLPFDDNSMDEIHAYDVLEHTGAQGDYKFFFAQWSDFWRILKPGGLFCGIVPSLTSRWAWGDPSHTRVIQSESLMFLNQAEYSQVGQTAMSDFRYIYKADFQRALTDDGEEGTFRFVLIAVKPARIK